MEYKSSSSSKGIIRGKNSYTQVSDDILRDESLSLKAKGLYILIQSYLVGRNNTVLKNDLKSNCKEGEKAFESAWKELKNSGYLIQYKLKDKIDGTFYYEYELVICKDKEY